MMVKLDEIVQINEKVTKTVKIMFQMSMSKIMSDMSKREK